jgi:MoaA/NifB/PqqE/SkfB family radical SAM enzyme
MKLLLDLSIKRNEILKTISSCPVCYKEITAKVIEENKKVFLEKTCPKHGNFKFLLENDVNYFKEKLKFSEKFHFSSNDYLFSPNEKDWKILREDVHAFLLCITNLCNLKCPICFEDCGIPNEKNVLTKCFNLNIKNVEELLKRIGKNKKIILFGGEPTLSKNLFKIIDMIKESKNRPVLYTNGVKLSNLKYVKKLKKSGLNNVILSFDGFSEEVHERLRGNKNLFYTKSKALKNLEKLKMEVGLAATIVSGINEDEIPKLLNFSIKNNHFIKELFLYRAIPFGRFLLNKDNNITGSDITKKLVNYSLGEIKLEYLLEFDRFKFNISKLLHHFGLNIPLFAGTFFNIKDGKICECIPLEDIRKLNTHIEKKNNFQLIKDVVKYATKIFKIEFLKIQPRFFGSNRLLISVLNIMTPLNYMPISIFSDSFVIRKKNKFKDFNESIQFVVGGSLG